MEEQMTRILKVLAAGMEAGGESLPGMAKELLESFANFHLIWVYVFGFITLISLLGVLVIFSRALKYTKLYHIYIKTNSSDRYAPHVETSISLWLGTAFLVFSTLIFFFSMSYNLAIALEPLGYILNTKL